MKATTYDFEVFRGDDEPLSVQLNTQDPITNVITPYDFTGQTVRWAFRWPGGSFVLGNADLNLVPATGDIQWVPTEIITLEFPKGRVTRYELKLIDTGGQTITWLEGFINAKGDGL